MRRLWIVAAVTLCLFVAPLFADSGSSSAPFPGGIGAIIMWYICSSRRKQEIGGWLLYFYIQLYIGVIITVVALAVSFKNYLPATWAAEPQLYPLFLLSMVPAVIIFPVQLVIAEKLRRSRDSHFVAMLRYALWADLLLTALATAIDQKYFPDNLALDIFAFIWPVIWIPYLHMSKRVKAVFVTKTWLVPPVVAAPA